MSSPTSRMAPRIGFSLGILGQYQANLDTTLLVAGIEQGNRIGLQRSWRAAKRLHDLIPTGRYSVGQEPVGGRSGRRGVAVGVARDHHDEFVLAGECRRQRGGDRLWDRGGGDAVMD